MFDARQIGESVEFDVWVVPGANRSEIKGLHDGALRVRVSAPAKGGRANQAMLQLLEDVLGRRVDLVRGLSSRRKTVRIEGLSLRESMSILGLETPG